MSRRLNAVMRMWLLHTKWCNCSEAIYKGKVLKADSTKELIKQLSTLKPSYIPRELPDGVRVANKPGELEGVRTDSGIVFSANRPFAIQCDDRLCERRPSRRAGDQRRCSRSVHYFEMRSKTSEYGRILPAP